MDNQTSSVPKHIGIIMDGNGRWATMRQQSRSYGHHQGAAIIYDIVKACKNRGVKYLTLYAFSYENNKRPKDEVETLLHIFVDSITKYFEGMQENKVRFNFIGDLEHFDPSVRESFEWCKEETKNNDAIELTISINYSSRDEIRRAVQNIATEVKNNKIQVEDIDENMISGHLDTALLPDPDLIIRTGGEYRLSNFLLWQASYAELYFTDVLWPDFTEQHLAEAIESYSHRQRRFGQVK